jgi:hypothetical protein
MTFASSGVAGMIINCLLEKDTGELQEGATTSHSSFALTAAIHQ